MNKLKRKLMSMLSIASQDSDVWSGYIDDCYIIRRYRISKGTTNKEANVSYAIVFIPIPQGAITFSSNTGKIGSACGSALSNDYDLTKAIAVSYLLGHVKETPIDVNSNYKYVALTIYNNEIGTGKTFEFRKIRGGY